MDLAAGGHERQFHALFACFPACLTGCRHKTAPADNACSLCCGVLRWLLAMPQPSAHIVHLRGTDAVAFAQAQFASDLSTLESGRWQWSAWLDRRGRVRALLQLARDGEDLHALLRGGSGPNFGADLRRYVLRAQVDISVSKAITCRAGPARPEFTWTRSGAGLSFGFRTRSLIAEADGIADTSSSWLRDDIAAGFPWLPDAAIGKFLPSALRLNHLAAVSVTKGCYPGQEIVTRLHHRVVAGLRLCRYRITPGQWQAGQTLRAGAEEAGLVLACVGEAALAVVHERAHGSTELPTLMQVFEP